MARTLFELYLKHSGRYELAEAIESASMAELYCLKNPVNLIIMDVCTALKASGLTAAAKIKKNSPGIRIVLVTSQPECDFIHRAKEAGIDSFWYKEPLENSLLSVLDRTMAGESVYPEDTPVLKVGEALSILQNILQVCYFWKQIRYSTSVMMEFTRQAAQTITSFDVTDK